jgi:integrase
MAVGKVTNSAIAKLDSWLWDRTCQGFGARRQRGAVYFYVRYRLNGSQNVRSIGRNGSPWTCDTARNEAKRLLGIVASGVDPFAQSLSGETFGAEVERYSLRQRNSLKPRSFIEDQRYLRKHAAPLHKLRLGDIDRRTIAVLLGQRETACGPIARNRLRSSLSAFFAWAIAEGLTETSPVQGTAKAYEGNGRDRVLTQDELRKLWHALGDGRYADIVRLLLLTGQRRTEISRLTWSEVDFDRKLIVLGAERTKNSRSHEVPLSSQALAILARQDRRTEFVFSKFMNWSAAKAKLDAKLGIAPWRLHDLRRSCSTWMAELGVLPHIIEAVLNHVSGHKAGVAGRYNWAKYADEMRTALQRWADYVEALIVEPRKRPVPTGLMERAFAVARGGKIVPEEDLANLARQIAPLKRA